VTGEAVVVDGVGAGAAGKHTIAGREIHSRGLDRGQLLNPGRREKQQRRYATTAMIVLRMCRP
jgi:hypothetical protein